MNLDTDQTGAPEAPSDDLRSTIAAALASQRDEAPAKVEAETPAPETPAEPVDTEKRADGRDDKGRFAPKPAETPTEGKALETPAVEQPEAEKPPAPAAEALRAPPGWSPAAKVAFEKADPAIREAVARREQEINQGFAKLADYKGLDDFADLAKKSGTTLGQAFQNYRAVETTLQRDFVGGIRQICERFGVDHRALAGILSNTEAAPARQPQNIDPNALVARAKAEALQEFQQQQATQSTEAAIAQFQSDPANRFFDNVRPQMAALMQAGSAASLKEAYDAACWANPQIRSILISESAAGQTTRPANPAAATQARAAAKAVSGAPSPGLKPGSNSANPNASLRETIEAARNAQLGRA